MKSDIKSTPTSYQEVMTLLQSAALCAIEDSVASQVGKPVLRDYSIVETSLTLAEISVSGMTPGKIESFLHERREELIKFGIRFLNNGNATKDEEEYPEGEEVDEPLGESVSRGLGTGFGIKLAIYVNFLVNRSKDDFHRFLKNRRIPHHTKFAKELKRIYDDMQGNANKAGQ